jgi:phospholipid/cholesterol/gamma-HCH transport system ATP-binding protein
LEEDSFLSVLKVNSLSRSFAGVPVLSNVNFALKRSSINGLIGPSGGGKSVLLKIIAHTCHTDVGSVGFPRGCSPQDVGLMFQEGALFDSLSVYDNVAFPLVAGNVPTTNLSREEREIVRDKVSSMLARVGLSRAAFKMPGQISGGMRRRVSLARALVGRPKILLLDDPTSGLDPVASSVIMDLIVELHAEYEPTTILVSHDLRRLLPVVERVLALFDGRIVYDGSIEDLATQAPSHVRSFVSCRYEIPEHLEENNEI